jgi:hypothetical protein
MIHIQGGVLQLEVIFILAKPIKIVDTAGINHPSYGNRQIASPTMPPSLRDLLRSSPRKLGKSSLGLPVYLYVEVS